MKLLRDKECEKEGGRMSVRERTSTGTRESDHSEKRVTVWKQQRMWRQNGSAPSRSSPQVCDVRKMS